VATSGNVDRSTSALKVDRRFLHATVASLQTAVHQFHKLLKHLIIAQKMARFNEQVNRLVDVIEEQTAVGEQEEP